MKKILSFLALALAFTACQNEPVETVVNGDLVDVVLTVDAPELGVTRADGDALTGKNSALGAIDFMNDADWANYDLRYILEVYNADDDGTGTPIYRERLVNCLDKYAPTTFELRLVPNRDYKFVVFADFVAEGNAELTEPADKLAIADLYYNTADLRNITAITTEPTWGAMNEVRDAYFVTKKVHITTALSETLTLTRPFAKLRVIATDLDFITGYSVPGYVEITYKNEPVYKSFNAVSGLLNAEQMAGDELTYGYEVSKTIPYSEGYDAYSTNMTLFTDYLLAKEGEQTGVNFEMKVYESKGGALIHSQDFNTQIPIQRNHLTTIIGDLLTTQANITIEIDDNFVDEFVIGWGDDNATKITAWEPGVLNADGDYEFVVKGENEFIVTVNSAAVENGALKAGNYVWADTAAEDAALTFSVKNLQADQATRALTDVEVIGGKMNVVNGDVYTITLDLVLQFVEEQDVRHAIYTFEGAIAVEEAYKLYLNNVEAWESVYVYAWDAENNALLGEFPGSKMTATETIENVEYLVFVLPTELSGKTINVSFNDGTEANKSDDHIVEVVSDNYFSNYVETVEPEALATPVVTSVVDGNVVTLTWEAVEGAANYSITCGNEMPVFVEGTSYEFTGEYATEYTFVVVAVPADEEANLPSEAATVTVTTEAEPAEGPTYTTVAEFLAAPVDANVEYTLSGTITRVANTTYGNFDLTDDTGTVYIYGLCSPEGAQKYWAASGAKIGDDIVIKTVRAEYNGSAQGSNAKFVDLVSPGTRAFWSFSKDAVAFGSVAGEQNITVDAYNLTADVNVTSDNTQFTASYADGVLTIVAAENTTTEKIEGNITVTCGTLEQVITVTQSGVSVGGGTEVAAEATMSDFGWANAAAVAEAQIDDNVTLKFEQGTASTAPAYYTSGEAVRLYQNGAKMTVTANGKSIKSIEMQFAQGHYYIAPNVGEFTEEGDTRIWTGDATEIVFTTTGTDKSHRAYLSAIKVTYIE